MRYIHKLFIAMLVINFSCTDGYIDDVKQVDSENDESAPVVNINSPLEGAMIRVTENVTDIDINFEVTDDVEIATVVLRLNDTQIASFDEFIDYRRFVRVYNYDNITNGEHTLTITATDLSGKSTSSSVTFEKVEPYSPVYDNEIFYMPFDGDYTELISIQNATIVGSPSFADGLTGRAYAGAADSYITFPTEGLLHDEFSAVFWYKVNATPDRGGMLVIGPPDPNNPSNPNNRAHGFRLFRENANGMQRVKLNVGNGTDDNWFDGGAAADIDPAASEWVHVAFTISESNVTVYLDGEVVSQGSFPGISWAGTNIISIGSGAPRFTEWGHLSDRSLFDELRIFNTALTQEQIQGIIEDEQP